MSAAKRLRIAAMLASPPQSPARKPDVAIRDVRAYAIREPDSGRSWVTVVVETDSGVKGYGECAASPDPEAAKVSLLRHRADLVGQDALANVAMDRLLQLAPAEVRAAVDMALLDIKGKQLKAPIYELLSGRTRDKVRGLAVLGSNDAALGEARSAGFRAFSVPLQIPSGPTRGRAFYAQTYQRVSSLRRDGEDFVLDCTGSTTAAQAGVLAAEFEKFHLLWLDEPAGDINEEALRKISGTVTPLGWGRSMADNGELHIPGYYEWIEGNQAISAAVDRLAMLREALGNDIDIGIDFHAKTSPAVAAIICKEVEPLNLMFIEEPCPPENYRAMAKIARKTTTPIATGERLVAHYSVQQLLEDGTVDILQCDINHVGGITPLWKVGAMAETSGCAMAPHACEGPIGGMATLNVDAATPNFIVQEICSGVEPTFKEKLWEEWLGFPAMRMINGYFPLPNKPGLGFEMNEALLSRHPFKGTKPMARVFHEDGSVAAW